MIKSNYELPIALQLFSLREMMEDNFEAGLRTASEIGFKYIECALPGDITLDEAAELLKKYDLKIVAVHAELKQLQIRYDGYVEASKKLGFDTLVMPWNEIRRAKEAIQYAEEANEMCAKYAKEGIKLAYHNHDHEFYREHKTGEMLLDVLFEHFDPSITWEMDIYWTKYAHCNPLEMINRMKGRIRLAHIKEISKGEPKTNPEIGLGEFNIPEIVTALREIGGTEMLIIEQEQHTMPEKESCEYSFNSLSKMIKGDI